MRLRSHQRANTQMQQEAEGKPLQPARFACGMANHGLGGVLGHMERVF